MPNQVLNLIQDLRISASRLSLGFDLAFELDSPSVHHFVRHLKFTGSINAVYC
jgi:hypothetical protein